jgi:hypothetical protein
VATFSERSSAPLASRIDEGSAGRMRSTYFAPNTVVEAIRASTFAGM